MRNNLQVFIPIADLRVVEKATKRFIKTSWIQNGFKAIKTSQNKKMGNNEASQKQHIAAMFNKIAKKYDFLNHFLSFGIDILWRKKAVAELTGKRVDSVLDVATGTGDLALALIRKLKPIQVIGVDIAQGMLSIAEKKAKKHGYSHVFETLLADSENLPFNEGTFDAVTVAYGVRNFEHVDLGLKNMHRVLKPGCKVVILEFSKPHIFPIKQLYHLYFHYLIPIIGWLFSSDKNAYRYLPASVAAFPEGEAFLLLMQKAGFVHTKCKPLAFGICSLYTGIKP